MERSVRHLRVVLGDVEFHQRASTRHRVQAVREQPLMLERAPERLHKGVGEGHLDLAKMRSRPALNKVASTSPFTFSTPESAHNNGRPASTRCLPAASNSWHVFDGSKRSVTAHARIFREKLSTTAWRHTFLPSINLKRRASMARLRMMPSPGHPVSTDSCSHRRRIGVADETLAKDRSRLAARPWWPTSNAWRPRYRSASEAAESASGRATVKVVPLSISLFALMTPR